MKISYLINTYKDTSKEIFKNKTKMETKTEVMSLKGRLLVTLQVKIMECAQENKSEIDKKRNELPELFQMVTSEFPQE